MLPQQHRLPLRQVDPFYTFPLKIHLPQLSVFCRSVSGQAFAQAAIVVSKKVAPTAVERNAIKRRFRVILSSLLPQLPGAVQMVVQIKRAEELQSSTFSQEFQNKITSKIQEKLS